jgi:hypothetical protein
MRIDELMQTLSLRMNFWFRPASRLPDHPAERTEFDPFLQKIPRAGMQIFETTTVFTLPEEDERVVNRKNSARAPICRVKTRGKPPWSVASILRIDEALKVARYFGFLHASS